ncbi:MAG: MFS transporter [Christensenellaceae bacterium]|jgi:MFS family permease|nr:MFS transporter [Christensenellaceae bacterium]
MKTKPDQLKKPILLSILVFGLFGQVAWTLENMYLNVFIHETISDDPNIIALSVSLSAVTATLTAILMGSFSDKIGKRKIIIVVGYICWGISIMLFGFLNKSIISKMFPLLNATVVAAFLVIFMDCLLTFFGSAAYDASFNAWITDVTTEKNRGQAEGILSVLYLFSTLLVFGALGGLVAQSNWLAVYLITGGVVLACGVLGVFIIKDKPSLKPQTTNYMKTLVAGFKIKAIKSNPPFYLALVALAIYGLAQQIYMPYILIYIEHFLGITDYVILVGIVWILSAVICFVCGSIADKHGKRLLLVITLAVAVVGTFVMYLQGLYAKTNFFLIVIGAVLMLGGGMVVSILLTVITRDYSPPEARGNYAGIRMIAIVLIPMITGPFIGSAIIKGNSTIGNENVLIPNSSIFLFAAIATALVILPILFINKHIKPPAPKPTLRTKWGMDLIKNQNIPLLEYPRPQFVRDSYLNLNGPWKYSISLDGNFNGWDGEILVPFSPESQLSGVNKVLKKNQKLFYWREFIIVPDFLNDLTYLHFGAVDQTCNVFVNNTFVGKHVGGYLPFSFDITSFINIGFNEIKLEVEDLTDTSYYSHGKQSIHPRGIWYSPQSGIWQTVWIESVPEKHIQSVKMLPNIDEGYISITPLCTDNEIEVDLLITFNSETVTTSKLKPNRANLVKLTDFKLWSPECPNLYDVELVYGKDKVKTYFGMRKFSMARDKNSILRITLNNNPYFHNGLLDQGYWPDGLLTPPSDEALLSDILKMKELGFNVLRKHIKIEPLRWYYHCDRLGMIVWQDMVNGGGYETFMIKAIRPFLGWNISDGPKNYAKLGRKNPIGRELYYKETDETINLLYNATSIAVWVPFNESWGQFDSLKVVEFIKDRDTSRLIDHASGWYDQGGGDFKSYHTYFVKIKIEEDKKRVSVLSEFGGYSYKVTQHVWDEVKMFGYKMCKTSEEFNKEFESLYKDQIIPAIKNGLSATIYTQVTDVEEEINGLLTYDRAVCKVNIDMINAINTEIMNSLE